MAKEMSTFIDELKDEERSDADGDLMLKNMKTLKNNEQFVQQCREELVIERSLDAKHVQHKGILIQKGVIQYSHSRNSEQLIGEVIGDCQIGPKNEETVLQIRDEFVEQLNSDARYASLKGILLEKGILKYSDNESDLETNKSQGDYLGSMREEYVLRWSSNAKPAYLKEVLKEKGFMRSWINESEIEVNESNDYEDEEEQIGMELTHKRSSRNLINNSIDMAKIISDINKFTANLESDPHHIDWQQFRKNLAKVHSYYVDNMEHADRSSVTTLMNIEQDQDSELPAGLNEVDNDIDNLIKPLNEVIERSKMLSSNIQGIEERISCLDVKVEQFHSKYYQTLLNREKAYKDMMALQLMRERIGQRLTQIEFEIHTSKTQLLQRGVQNK